MQTKSLNFIEQDNSYKIKKRVFEITVCVFALTLLGFIFFYFLFRKLVLNKDIFKSKRFFLNEFEVATFKVLNSKSFFIKNLCLMYYVLINKISLVGVALVKYKDNITYKVNYRPGIFSLWFVRKNAKMANCNISSCNKEYIQNQSFFNDIKVIIKSLISLLYLSNSNRFTTKVKIFDTVFSNLTMKNVMEFIKKSISSNEKKSIFFINADCLNKTFKSKVYKETLKKASLILPDGSGINMACNILNTPLLENVNGTDMLPHLCKLCEENGFKVFLLGSKDDVALKTKNELQKKYPKLNIVGTHHGYIDVRRKKESAINYINETKPDILLVAMGAPLQEFFIDEYKDRLNAKVIIGVGGLFDFYSTNIKRAPMYLRETGFEWVYRMIQEPSRMWRRYIIGNPLFLFRVFRYKKQIEKNNLINNYLKNYDKPKKYRLQKAFWKINNNLSAFLKRALDIVASMILLLLFSPLFLIVAIIIKATSKGDVFFVQDRVGINGKLFKMFKFRSMVVDAEELKQKLMDQNQSSDGVIFKMKDDPRITKIGKFIRKTSIDELPQLANVLLGQMSLVGPRPPVIDEVKQYNMDDKKRLDAKPGITCIWQVSGRSNIPFKQQVQMDKEYIRSQSLIMDIVLLFKTIPAVLFQKGSC